MFCAHLNLLLYLVLISMRDFSFIWASHSIEQTLPMEGSFISTGLLSNLLPYTVHIISHIIDMLECTTSYQIEGYDHSKGDCASVSFRGDKIPATAPRTEMRYGETWVSLKDVQRNCVFQLHVWKFWITGCKWRRGQGCRVFFLHDWPWPVPHHHSARCRNPA